MSGVPPNPSETTPVQISSSAVEAGRDSTPAGGSGVGASESSGRYKMFSNSVGRYPRAPSITATEGSASGQTITWVGEPRSKQNASSRAISPSDREPSNP